MLRIPDVSQYENCFLLYRTAKWNFLWQKSSPSCLTFFFPLQKTVLQTTYGHNAVAHMLACLWVAVVYPAWPAAATSEGLPWLLHCICCSVTMSWRSWAWAVTEGARPRFSSELEELTELSSGGSFQLLLNIRSCSCAVSSAIKWSRYSK